MGQFGSSADLAELIMGAVAVASLLLAAGAAYYWRRDGRLVFGVFAGAILASGLSGALLHWDELLSFCALFLESCAAGMIAYSLLRWRALGFSPAAALCGGFANAALPPLVLAVLRPGVAEHDPWAFAALMPIALLLGLVIAAIACAVRAAFRGMPVRPERIAAPGGGGDHERQAVLKMLADGKVSAEEASELLAALGPSAMPGDRLPLSGGTLASLAAGIMIATGFVLPWVPVRMGNIHGYQAGHHVGFLGWLILILGLLPAVLACVPALDSYLRQGMLRLLLACTGLAFAGSVAVRVMAGGGAPGIGLILVLLGFGVELLSALVQTGLLHAPSRPAGD